jgi:CBS domain containing-hemolysin-like protein
MDWLELAIAIPASVLLLSLSVFFSGTEVALFSLRRVDREQLARSTSPGDDRVRSLLAQPRKLVTTVLIGNEVVNALLMLVAMAAATAQGDGPWHGAVLAFAFALPAVVLVGEVMPKPLALKAPKAWARATSHLLWAFSLLLAPVRWLVQGTSELLLRPLGDPGRTRPDRDMTEEEFRSLLDAGSAQGQVDARERRLIHKVFEFSDKSVGQVMTPRDKIFAVSYDLPMARLAKEVAVRGFSRVPVFQKSLDNIRGVLSGKDLVRMAAGQAPTKALGDLLHEPLFVPRNTPIKRLFRTFKQRRIHLGIVVNEYGKVLGLVTMDDLLSQLFGAFRDEREALQSGRVARPSFARLGAARPSLDAGPAPSPEAMTAEAASDEVAVEPAPAVQVANDDPSDGSPVPITDADTGPSGPIPTRGPA